MSKKTIKINIQTDYIQLQQLLKIGNIIDSGGMAKIFLEENKVLVNEEIENRRGRKLYPGDVIRIKDKEFEIVK